MKTYDRQDPSDVVPIWWPLRPLEIWWMLRYRALLDRRGIPIALVALRSDCLSELQILRCPQSDRRTWLMRQATDASGLVSIRSTQIRRMESSRVLAGFTW